MPSWKGDGMGDTGLSLADVEAYRNQGKGKKQGGRLRFFCPVHGGDNQRSLSADPEKGLYHCHSCGAKGQFTEFRESALEEWKAMHKGTNAAPGPRPYTPTPKDPAPAPRPDLAETLAKYQANLTPESWGAKYLEQRGFTLDLARRFGLGFAPKGDWVGRAAPWGRVVFPHQDPDGQVVNLYGRAVEGKKAVDKGDRHDHLTGPKGAFNAPALKAETVFLTEGPFDCLALLASGVEDAAAIYGLTGFRWEWVLARTVVFCLDQDGPGAAGLKALAEDAVKLGKRAFFLDPETYRGQKDLAEAYLAGGPLDLAAILGELAAPDPTDTVPGTPTGTPAAGVGELAQEDLAAQVDAVLKWTGEHCPKCAVPWKVDVEPVPGNPGFFRMKPGACPCAEFEAILGGQA